MLCLHVPQPPATTGCAHATTLRTARFFPVICWMPARRRAMPLALRNTGLSRYSMFSSARMSWAVETGATPPACH